MEEERGQGDIRVSDLWSEVGAQNLNIQGLNLFAQIADRCTFEQISELTTSTSRFYTHWGLHRTHLHM